MRGRRRQLGGYSNTAGATTPTTPAHPGVRPGGLRDPAVAADDVTIPFTGAQRTGHFNVVVVGWNDTNARVASVTDTAGNAYLLAIGPTEITDVVSSPSTTRRTSRRRPQGTS